MLSMLTTTPARRNLSSTRTRAAGALVGMSPQRGLLDDIADFFGWITLGVGAAVFFGGLSGGIGLAVMGTSIGSILIKETKDTPWIGLGGFALFFGSAPAAWYLYQQPKVNAWYNKTWKKR